MPGFPPSMAVPLQVDEGHTDATMRMLLRYIVAFVMRG